MKAFSLLALRVTLGWLMLVWGIDKIVNVEHALAVSEGFYLGIIGSTALWQGLGVLQILLGLAVIAGMGRRIAYPVLFLVNGASSLGVWASIIDPWGWVLDGTNALFFPSIIIIAAVFVVWAFQDEDVLSFDHGRRASSSAGETRGAPVA